MKRLLKFGVAVGLLSGLACQSEAGESPDNALSAPGKPDVTKSKVSTSLVAASTESSGKGRLPRKTPKPNIWHVPVGPQLGIFRGKGLGPIRFGATAQTVSRHMQAPCKVESLKSSAAQSVCRYPAHAVEYFFEEGGLIRVAVHGQGRLVSAQPKIEYGIFNGGFVEGARFGMLIAGVEEFLGKPISVAAAPADHPYGAVEIHYYPGAELQFDRSRHGQLLLAGVVLEKSGTKSKP